MDDDPASHGSTRMLNSESRFTCRFGEAFVSGENVMRKVVSALRCLTEIDIMRAQTDGRSLNGGEAGEIRRTYQRNRVERERESEEETAAANAAATATPPTSRCHDTQAPLEDDERMNSHS